MTRRYIYIAVGVALVVLMAGVLFGQGIASWLISVQTQAVAAGLNPALAGFMVGPLITAMQNPVVGAIVAGVAWPLFAVWLVLLFIAVIYGFGAGAVRDLDSQVSLFWM